MKMLKTVNCILEKKKGGWATLNGNTKAPLNSKKNLFTSNDLQFAFRF